MANRTSIIFAEISIPRLLEKSDKAKERFKLLHDFQTFDAAQQAISITEIAINKATLAFGGQKDSNAALDKKISMLRMQRSFLKQALNKKLRRAITDKLVGLLENQYSQMQSSMPIGSFFDMI